MGDHKKKLIHKVKQGDYLASIASDYGFGSWEEIWNHDENEGLRTLRENPQVLYPGDQVSIPEKTQQSEPAATEVRHRFIRKFPKILIRIDIRDRRKNDTDREDPECCLKMRHEDALLSPEEDILEHEILVTEKNPTLLVDGRTYPIHIGHLDPVDKESGQWKRLHNLGYLPRPFDSKSKHEKHELEGATADFQADQDLQIDGVCGPKTQSQLIDVHGS